MFDDIFAGASTAMEKCWSSAKSCEGGDAPSSHMSIVRTCNRNSESQMEIEKFTLKGGHGGIDKVLGERSRSLSQTHFHRGVSR